LLDFFQTKRGLKLDSFPIFSPIFSFLTLAVYPVSVTKYWCCQNIGVVFREQFILICSVSDRLTTIARTSQCIFVMEAPIVVQFSLKHVSGIGLLRDKIYNLIIVFTLFTMTKKVTACKVPFIDHWYLLSTANTNAAYVLSTRTLVIIL